MASRALQLKPKLRTPFATNPNHAQLFSSSSSNRNSNVEDSDTTSSSYDPPSPSQFKSQPGLSSYFSDVKASLKTPRNQSSPLRRDSQSTSTERRPHPPLSSLKPQKVASLEEIRKNLSEFRSRSTVAPPGSGTTASQNISFQEIYKRNVVNKGGGPEDSSTVAAEAGGGKSGSKMSIAAIRESLRQLRSPDSKQNDRGFNATSSMSLSRFKDSLKLRPQDPSTSTSAKPFLMGGSDTLPASVFGKEMRDKKEPESAALKTEFVRMYNYGELGEKLRKLRPPDAKGDNWFSLEELNDRLVKLRESEERETESRIGGVFQDLRHSLVRLQMSDEEKMKNASNQRLEILGQLGRSTSFISAPPKEHLVEQYFHPDNMSSEEKMKLELKKVKDEFKMSESDCGSARVQVAQLTTKIKHLSTVLHKKDKHSRKGLMAMVQRRKKLLKYLRTKDWESYCFVLSRLGLRDNPDYKN